MDEPVVNTGSADESTESQINTANTMQSGRDTKSGAPRKPKKSKRAADTFEKDVMDVLKKPTATRPQDTDEMFLLSLVPRVKKMSSSDKLNFQIGVMNLIKSYTEPILRPRIPQNLPSMSASSSYCKSPSQTTASALSPVQPSVLYKSFSSKY
jgi:hypothetical protein